MATTQYKQPVITTPKAQKDPAWTPMAGVSLNSNTETKKSGVKIRGTGAAKHGTMARGPMA